MVRHISRFYTDWVLEKQYYAMNQFIIYLFLWFVDQFHRHEVGDESFYKVLNFVINLIFYLVFSVLQFWNQLINPCPNLQKKISLHKLETARGGATLDHAWIVFTKFREIL